MKDIISFFTKKGDPLVQLEFQRVFGDCLKPFSMIAFVIASKGDRVATVQYHKNEAYILIKSKSLKYSYEFGLNNRTIMSTWQLELNKSRLLNEGFMIDWSEYSKLLGFIGDIEKNVCMLNNLKKQDREN